MEQTKTKPKNKSEPNVNKPTETFSFHFPPNIEAKNCNIGLTSLGLHNYLFNLLVGKNRKCN